MTDRVFGITIVEYLLLVVWHWEDPKLDRVNCHSNYNFFNEFCRLQQSLQHYIMWLWAIKAKEIAFLILNIKGSNSEGIGR